MFEGAGVCHRFFFAVLPPITLARQIANAADWFAEGGTPVRADRLHITMFLLDDFVAVPDDLTETLREIGAGIAADPMPIALDIVGGGTTSVALRPRKANPALHDLHRQIAAAACREGIAERAGHDFHPHMTLGYRHGRPFTQRVAPVAWTADRVVLIHSHLGRTRHELLGEWVLDGGVQRRLF